MKLLLVENEPDTADALATSLVAQLFTVDIAINGLAALELAEVTEYDLIVLDVMLPEVDGISLCRQLRAHNQQEPILLLTAKDEQADLVAGFEAGADNYVTKPYELSDLLARIRALLRRGNTVLTEVLCWGRLQLELNNCEVTCQGTPVRLTPKEYKLLELFLRHPRRIFDRRTLLDRVWSMDECPGEEAVTTQICGLRRKLQLAELNPDPIETLYGLGYRLRAVPEERQEAGEAGGVRESRSQELLSESSANNAEAETALHSERMKCIHCAFTTVSKNGHRRGKQCYICRGCGRQFLESYDSLGYQNSIKEHCLKLYVNGMGFRAIERVTGVNHNTVINWIKQAGTCLADAPEAAEIPEVTQVDELETFVGKKTRFGCGRL